MADEPGVKRPRTADDELSDRPPDRTPQEAPLNLAAAATTSVERMSPVKPAEEPISFVVITNDGTDVNFER